MGTSGSIAGKGRAARVLRLLLLLGLALIAFEYLFGTMESVSSFRTYLYTPTYNYTQDKLRKNETLDINSTESQSKIIPKQIQEPRLNNNTFSSPTSKITDKIADNFTEEETSRIASKEDVIKTTPTLTLCDATPPDLGPVPVNKTELKLDDVENMYPSILPGGHYIPPNCIARHKVAIIVPYRDREQHLAIFLNHIHPFLMKQQIEYAIFIIEQKGGQKFNRAKLMNVGFVESQKAESGEWQCFIFHDVDLLPSDTRNMYTCPKQPRHMSAAIDTFHYKLPYKDLFGGVSAITKEQFKEVNGFSNKYWGWGGEDDDMFRRLNKKGYTISRYDMAIARYTMLSHAKSTPNPKRYNLLSKAPRTFLKDGLSTLEYNIEQVTRHHLYTHILVNIDEL